MKPTSFQIARLAFLVALTLILQSMGLPQPLTGPLINTILFVTAHLMGPAAGIILGVITPGVALIRGQLPAVLAPMVPFIAIGNAMLVLIYVLTRRNTERAVRRISSVVYAILLASSCKFIVLLLAVRFVVPIFIGHRLPPQIETIMALPQLITALAGGLLFLLIFTKLDQWAGPRGNASSEH